MAVFAWGYAAGLFHQLLSIRQNVSTSSTPTLEAIDMDLHNVKAVETVQDSMFSQYIKESLITRLLR